MATLDEFVRKIKETKTLKGYYENDFRFDGGTVFQIKPGGEFQSFGLGIFNAILECYDKPIDSDSSTNFQHLLSRTRPRDVEIFNYNLLSQAIHGGLISLTSINQDAYSSMKTLSERLYHNFEALRRGLSIDKREDDKIKKISERIQRLTKTNTQESFMQQIFNESSELAHEICTYLLSWIESCWHQELPIEYKALEATFTQLRQELRANNYKMSVPDDIKNFQYVKQVDVNDVPIKDSHLFLTSTPEELIALEQMKYGCKRNILYTGDVTTDLERYFDTRKNDDNIITNPKIKGSNQYKKYLKRKYKK
ncbi:hypothetical protein GOV12_07390 [Candidatus Pacearchaeota archaeon]|nr:hypothetical protein [Candidatus Pacearchaeota archaeon]